MGAFCSHDLMLFNLYSTIRLFVKVAHIPQKRISGLFSLLLVALFMGHISTAAIAQPGDLTVKLTGISSARGKMMLALFRSADGFPSVHQKAVKIHQVAARTGEMTIVFPQLPAGTYALAVYHDENSDMVLNTNLVGAPKEGYTFSNNARPKFRAPTFDEAAFAIKGATQLSLNIKY